MNYTELLRLHNSPEEETDVDGFAAFVNDFNKQIEFNDCLTLRLNSKEFIGSDKQFEEILTMFPEHYFEEQPRTDLINKYVGRLSNSTEDYFTLDYSGFWLSKFDLVDIRITGTESEWEMVKEKYNLN